MGSLLGSSLALQYLDCVQDESAVLRLNFWLGYALHEGEKSAWKMAPHHCNIFCQKDASEAKTLSWTLTYYLVGISKGFFQRVVKKEAGDCFTLWKCSKNETLYLFFSLLVLWCFSPSKYSFSIFLWRVFILHWRRRLPEIGWSRAVFKQIAVHTVLSPGKPHVSFRSTFESLFFALSGL